MSLQLQPATSKTQWEEFLTRHAPQSLFQSWLWGEVQEKTGQRVLRFTILDGKQLVGIAQVFVVRARRGTFLHVRHGPIWKEQKKEYWQEFTSIIGPVAKKEGAWFIRVSPLIALSTDPPFSFLDLGFVPAPIHAMDAEHCWVLDIDKSEEELLMGMRKTTRYEVKRAQKMGVSVIRSENIDDLKKFYALYDETSKRHGFVQHEGLTEEFEVFAAEKKAVLYLASMDNQIIAGALILFYGNQAIYHHGASLSSKVPASYLVQWHAFLEAKKRGLSLYNFWGIAPEDSLNHPWRGITLFKKGFGGRQLDYMHAHDLPISALYLIPKSIETIRRKMRGY
jgi:lipid II:glycine glycyltransferase (peptidoglycan interpeptide bridge formation enzyme)